MKKQTGVTLIELVIAIAIIGVLAAFAIPAYQEQVATSRLTDGQALLMNLQAELERHHFDNNGYPRDFDDMPNRPNPTISDEGFYSVTLVGGDCTVDPNDNALNVANSCNTYTLTAAPQGAQASAESRSLTLSSNGVKAPADLW